VTGCSLEVKNDYAACRFDDGAALGINLKKRFINGNELDFSDYPLF
jgi:hypothetical protein